MISQNVPPPHPRWLLVLVRVVLVTFLLTLLSFAISLTFGILGTIVAARARGLHPDMRIAYRDIAAPVALVAGIIGLISMTVLEIRRYRREKTLTAIARSS